MVRASCFVDIDQSHGFISTITVGPLSSRSGLDKYEAFLKASLANPNNYSAATLRGIMDGFKDVLFRYAPVLPVFTSFLPSLNETSSLYRHLDEEVRDLGAESMKAAGWTLAELKRIPM